MLAYMNVNLPPQGWLGASPPVLVGEADRPGVFRLASVLLLGGLLPFGDNVTNLKKTHLL